MNKLIVLYEYQPSKSRIHTGLYGDIDYETWLKNERLRIRRYGKRAAEIEHKGTKAALFVDDIGRHNYD